MTSRRRRARFAALAAVLLVSVWAAAGLMRPGAHDSPARLMAALVRETGLPGGVVAWGRPGTAPQAMAEGLADRGTGRPMRPDDRFRLASLTKPVTAAAVLALADAGRIDLDAPFAHRFHELAGQGLAAATPRNLLRHDAGWDRAETGGDPFFRTAADSGLAEPITGCRPVAAAAGSPQFPPGARHAYSNVGYCWLGEIVVAETGLPFAEALPALLGDRVAGLSLDPARLSVRHHEPAEAATLLVSRPAVIGPAGGLIGDAAAYLAFALTVDDPRIAASPAHGDGSSFYGLGWRFWDRPGARYLSHFGAMPGTFTLVLRRMGGGGVVMLFNGALDDPQGAAEWLIDRLIALPGWQ